MPPSPLLDVVIIGAGAAGLQCARALLNSAPSTTWVILEAADKVGGRVGQYDIPLPASYASSSLARHVTVCTGAEFVHGSTTTLNALIARGSFPTTDCFTASQGDGGPSTSPTSTGDHGVYWLGAEGKLLRYDATSDRDFTALNDALWSMTEMDIETVGIDDSVGDYLVSKGVPARMLGMAVAGYANTVGCVRMGDISLRRTIQYESYWEENDGLGKFLRGSPSHSLFFSLTVSLSRTALMIARNLIICKP